MLINLITLALLLSNAWTEEENYFELICIPNETGEQQQPEEVSDNCGISKPFNSRLNTDNDSYSKFGEFPWMVAIRYRHQHLAAATLLQADFVLTAAKFIRWKQKKWLLIEAGDFDTVSAQEEFPHLVRSADTIYYNEEIALIRLNVSFVKLPTIGFLCLPTMQDKFIWEIGTTTAWMKGRTDDLTLRNKLRKHRYRIMSPIECFNQLPQNYSDQVFHKDPSNDSHLKYICARDEFDHDSCVLNDGAALSCSSEGRHVLTGIALTNKHCRSFNRPAIFINIFPYISWIKETLALV